MKEIFRTYADDLSFDQHHQSLVLELALLEDDRASGLAGDLHLVKDFVDLDLCERPFICGQGNTLIGW